MAEQPETRESRLGFSLGQDHISFEVDESIYPLEAIYGACYLFLERCYVFLSRVSTGAVAVRLSGSGSTIFALFADRAAGQEAGDRLDNDTVWLPVKTLSRDDWRRRSGLGALSGGS